MDYLKKHISSSEKILLVGRVHNFTYLPGILSLVVALAFIGTVTILAIFFVLQAVFLFITFIGVQLGNEYVVTNKRLLVKRGFKKPVFFEFPHEKIKSVQVYQTLTGKIFNFGDLIIKGPLEDSIRVEYIKDPLELRNKTVLILDKIYDT